MRKIMLLLLLFLVSKLHAQTVFPDLGVYENAEYEFSGLCNVGEYLYMVPEDSPREDPLVKYNIKTKKFYQINLRNLQALKNRIDGFDGFEGVAYLDGYFYFTIETKLENKCGYVVKGRLQGDTTLEFDLEHLIAIPKPHMMTNTSFEAITAYGDSLLVAFEYNADKTANRFIILDKYLSENIRYLNFPHINYRLTDMVFNQTDSLVWGILYNYKKDNKNYFKEISEGNYFYLVTLDIKNRSWDLKQLKDNSFAPAINWEGITVVNKDFYMINDQFYGENIKKTRLIKFPAKAIESVPKTRYLKTTSIDTTLRYTDLHAHVTLKAVYNNQYSSEIPKHVFIHDSDKTDLRDFRIMRENIIQSIINMPNLQVPLLNYGWHKDPQLSHDKYEGLQSGFKDYDQCSFTNIAQRRFSIICASITPPERNIVNGGAKLNLAGKLVTGIDKDVLLRLNLNSDLSTLLNEYVFLSQHYTENNDFPDRVIRFVKDSTDLDSALVNNHTAMIFTIEGAHVLSNEHNNLNKTNAIEGNGIEKKNYFECNNACHDEVMFSIDVIKNLPHRLLFIEPSHFHWNNITGYPRSMDKPNFRLIIRMFPRFFVKKYAEGIFDTVFMKDYKLLRKRNFKPAYPFNISADHFPYQHRRLDKTHGNYPYAGVRRRLFRPNQIKDTLMKSNGNLGWSVIKKFLSDTDNHFKKPTYIDMKHMDVESRVQYINYIKAYNDTTKKAKIPLLVSHAACSGENLAWARLTSNFPNFDRYNEITSTERFYKRKRKQLLRKIKNVNDSEYPADKIKIVHDSAQKIFNTIPPYTGYFYPWGVNLYDEEIEAVYESKGLIGLMVDERTLGYRMKAQRKYYCKHKDFLEKRLDNHNETIKSKLAKYKIPSLTYERYINFEPFLRNLVYTINHLRNAGGKADATAWDHIAIGTDFDGFIDPICIIPSLDRMEAFRRYIECYFDFFLKHNPHVSDRKLKDKEIWDNRILFKQNINDLLNKLFYENTEKFVRKYF